MLKDIKDLKAYRIKEEKVLEEVNGKGYVLEHIKTKARVLLIQNDDKNKVFYIGFRTPPKDSTGVPHIIEHSVLCGSSKFPVKDPFVELCKGSLNTFLNAMTYSDKTVYPVASLNDKDFHNLMDVYLDAVFNPNMYSKKEIMMQEGWHYELESPDAPLTINGVVYNEMKGVYSSSDQIMYRAIEKSMLPDTEYSYDSGGFPDDIPDLTQEKFIEFHSKHYHPSNSYIYLYGDVDFVKELEYIDENYLSNYDYQEMNTEISEQSEFTAPHNYREKYSLGESEDLKDNTYLSYNTVIGKSTDNKLITAMDILSYVLLDSTGAPLKKAIIDAGICKDVEASFDSGINQPVFSIIAHNANEEDNEKFIKVIDETLSDLVENGISKRALEAAINKYEFKHKEGNFGRYPKGLMLGLDALGTWLYDDDTALMIFSMNDVYKNLREEINTGYFEELIKTYILKNNHKVYTVVYPVKGLNAKNDSMLRDKLEKYKNSLTEDEIKDIIENTKHLKEYQSTPSEPELLKTIPMLGIDDIDKKSRKLNNKVTEIEHIPVISHDIFTNGISYIDINFDIGDIDCEYYSAINLLTEILKEVDTDNYRYDELTNEIDLNTGGVGFSVGISDRINSDSYYAYFSVKTKVFHDRIDKAMKLIQEILFSSHIDDKKRLRELIAEIKTGMKTELSASGHITSSQRAGAYISKTLAAKEYLDGIEYYKFIEKYDNDFDAQYENLVEILKTALSQILRRGAVTVSYTADRKPEEMLKTSLTEFSRLLSSRPPFENKKEVIPRILNEGFMTSSKVQYVAAAGNYKKDGAKYTGALNVLQIILSYDYLWVNIRVKGGAYGAMCSFSRSGMAQFMSYRDPNLMETYNIFKEIPEYIRNFSADERDMTKYIIGAISRMDTPLTPQAEGALSYICYMLGVTEEDLQRERDEVLGADADKIRALAPLIETALSQGVICAIGDEVKIEEAKDNFYSVENVF